MAVLSLCLDGGRAESAFRSRGFCEGAGSRAWAALPLVFGNEAKNGASDKPNHDIMLFETMFAP